jgi:hypothetical protein
MILNKCPFPPLIRVKTELFYPVSSESRKPDKTFFNRRMNIYQPCKNKFRKIVVMKKLLILALAVMSVGAVSGQAVKKKVAVYTVDVSGQNIVEFVGDYVTNAIVKRGTYAAIERTAQFLEELGREQGFQRSGAVDDGQISKIGKNMGVHYVCVVKVAVSGAQKEHFISSRLIDVETAELASSSRPIRIDVRDWDAIEKSCEDVTASLFGERGGGNRGGSGNNRPSPGNGKHRNGDVYNYEGIELVFVEGTGGALGTPNFYIGKYEVTQAEWQKVMGNNPSNFKGANRPVEQVSWNDVQEFLRKLNALTGGNFRLPTEAEWEYAANGGLNKDNYEYAGSNTIGIVAWFTDNSGNATHPVGTKQPNSIGIYDMSGNVWEWCQDCYDSSCSRRVRRGGGWGSDASNCRVANRNYDSPGGSYDNLGFRLACSSE